MRFACAMRLLFFGFTRWEKNNLLIIKNGTFVEEKAVFFFFFFSKGKVALVLDN